MKEVMKVPKWTKEQEEAIVKSGSNIIVSAGAGSGKTAVLSERVLDKIKNNIHINELLILTFTKAAASEMKDRIRKKISNIPEYKEELNLLNSSYITTFDSFALSVVKKYHYLLNISSNVSICDDSILQIQEKRIIDEVFLELYDEKNEEFLNMIKKYCVKNDNTLKKNILNISNTINDYIDKNEVLNYIKNDFFKEENINNLIEKYKKLLEVKRSYVKLEISNMQYYFDSDYMSKVIESVSNILNSDTTELYKYTNVSLPRLSRGHEEEAINAKDNLKKSIDDLLSYSKFGSIENIKNEILSSKNMINVITLIVEKYIQKYNNYKKENSIYTFFDIASLAIKILKENDSAREELKYKFKEIMIDEYQDTNDIQEEFISLIANDNVYMVGDIKQSIYRFRGSNPSIFKEKYDNYSKQINGYKIDLIKNFRSRSEVLDNINRIFELLMDDFIGGASYKESHEMIYGNTLYDSNKENINYDMRILEYNKSKEFTNNEIEIFTIANDIKEKINNKIKVFDKETNTMRDANYNDFVIILDRSKYFDDYKKIFEYLGIPLTILKDNKLNISNDISIIKNIIDLIIRINNKDYGIEFKYDFMSIGRSFLYELDDNYLFNVFETNNFKDTSLYRDFASIKSINSKTINELIIEILNITDFYNKLYKIGNYEETNIRINKIYELSSSLNDLGYTIEDFRDYLNSIIEDGIDIKYSAFGSNSESVKIMTIHKSKGLEYPFCYFADLDHKFNDGELKEKFIINKKYGLITPSNLEDSNNNSVIKELYKKEFWKEEISEKIRLFYVALTRARENMIIVLPYKDTNKLEKDENGVIFDLRRLKFNKLSDLIYGIKDYLNNYFSLIDINKLGLTKDYLFDKNTMNLKTINIEDNINVEEIRIENDIVSESHFSKETNHLITKEMKKNMEYGTYIHEIFELIDFKNYDENSIEDEFIRNKLNKFLNNNIIKNIKDANIYQEYEFIYQVDNIDYHGIIDLMLEYDNHIDIIDYKLKNVLDDAYKAQLNGYKKYIESISNKKVNLYLYSILNEEILDI